MQAIGSGDRLITAHLQLHRSNAVIGETFELFAGQCFCPLVYGWSKRTQEFVAGLWGYSEKVKEGNKNIKVEREKLEKEKRAD